MKETFEEKLKRVTSEKVSLSPWNPESPSLFEKEKEKLQSQFPRTLIGRIEHMGSTAVPGLIAKPIIDMLVEVFSFDEAKREIAPVLEDEGYDYFWRPTHGDNEGPYYMWFIKRNNQGIRTHHIHMLTSDFTDHWERLLFRDFLIAHPERAQAYGDLKQKLAIALDGDRIRYTKAKSDFILETMKMVRECRALDNDESNE